MKLELELHYKIYVDLVPLYYNYRLEDLFKILSHEDKRKIQKEIDEKIERMVNGYE